MSHTPPYDRLTEAADLLREHGYAVVPGHEADRMRSAIKRAHDTTCRSYDQHLPLLWAMQALTDAASRALAPSRPVWLRDARSFLRNYRPYDLPAVSGYPEEKQ